MQNECVRHSITRYTVIPLFDEKQTDKALQKEFLFVFLFLKKLLLCAIVTTIFFAVKGTIKWQGSGGVSSINR